MANTLTLTNLTPDIYAAMDQVSRELTGAISSVTINSSPVDRVAINATVRSFKTAEPTLNTSVTPAMTIPSGDDQTVGTDTMTLDQVANVRIPITGEDVIRMNAGVGAEPIRQNMFKQAIRKIVNAIEAKLLLTIKNGSSRAYGTAGTTPFASDFKSLAQLRKILADNGTPFDGQVACVLNTTAGANLRSLAQLQKANEADSSELLRRGTLLDLQGFMLKESAGIAQHAVGTNNGAYVMDGGFAKGVTNITLKTGAGTILAGDVISIADDPSVGQYVVGTGLAAPGNIVLNGTGLTGAVLTGKGVTVAATYAGNVAFHKSAVELVMRPPAAANDAATDRMTISDPQTGLVFEIAYYGGYQMGIFDITVFYGAKVWKPEYVATLLG